ncbi:MFS transporter [Saliphagus infecundisoli]|uniref:Nitrate/nitrite transporter n=1 Tax=Saliphagus infecundisoli TaxID=1849069 RepID=A0ABD5QNI5_9EURY|nr:MFS transporter [Saliphagus infecundisoli]
MTVIDGISREVTALWGGGKGRSLLVVASGWGILLGARMIYPVLLPYLRTSFNLSLTVAGFLVTILWLGSALGQLPGGILADRYSERLIMTVGTITVAGALVGVLIAPTPFLLFAATAVVGLGQSLYPIARITILSDIYPDRIGSALGVTMATGDLGQTIFPPIAGVLAAAIAWQAGLGFLIPLLLLVGIVLWVVLPAQPPTEPDADSISVGDLPSIVARLRRENLLFVAFILFLYILIWQSFTGLYPTYLVDQKGLSSSAAGLLFSVFFAFGVIVKPLAGAAYDRIGMRRSLVLVLVGPVAGLTLLPIIEGFWLLGAVTALVSSMLGSGAITQSFLSDAIPDDIQGTGLGVVRTTSATLGAAGPVLFGGIADRGYFDEGYVLLAAVLVVVILLTLRLPESTTGTATGGH